MRGQVTNALSQVQCFLLDAIAIIEWRTVSKNFSIIVFHLTEQLAYFCHGYARSWVHQIVWRANPLLTVVLIGSAFLMRPKLCTDNLIILPFYLVHKSVHMFSTIRLIRGMCMYKTRSSIMNQLLQGRNQRLSLWCHHEPAPGLGEALDPCSIHCTEQSKLNWMVRSINKICTYVE